MRIRVRGPSGQSVITLKDEDTVSYLLQEIASHTSIPESSLTSKYGYPPKSLDIPESSKGSKVTELDVNLNGEQLIVSNGGPFTSPDAAPSPRTVPSSTMSSGTSSKGPVVKQDLGPTTTGQAQGFSFKDYGTAPPKPTPSSSAPRSSGPLSLQRKDQSRIAEDPPEVIVPEAGGTLVLRIMPDDNSCLFRAIAQAVTPSMDTMNELRSIVATAIQLQPEKYSKVVLDNKDPDDYCQWIQTDDAWGGQIELDILSQHFNIEICSIDVQTLRVDRYNEGMPTRCIVVYSGIHYDTIALSPFDMPPESDIKVFDAADDGLLASAMALCQTLQDRHYFTDTAGFQIKCNVCGMTVVGERGATEHASQTGHYDFGESA